MDFKTIQSQLKLSQKAVQEMNVQNRIFENILSEAVKGAPESDKGTVNEIKLKANQAIQFAKQGKPEKAQKIIEELQIKFTNGS